VSDGPPSPSGPYRSRLAGKECQMKERYRRIPIELIISPQYEGLKSDARLVWLSLIISPRQTPAGIYEGRIRSLEYETALPTKRLTAALRELEEDGLILSVSSGGWWVKDTFRAQCCNEDYAKAALKILRKKYPETLPDFLKENDAFLEKYPAISRTGESSDPQQTGDRRLTDPPQTSAVAVAVTGSETETGSGSGAGAAPQPPPATGSVSGSGRGDADAGRGGFEAPPPGASSTARSDNGNGKATPSGKDPMTAESRLVLMR